VTNNNLATPFHGNADLQNYDQQRMLRQIQNSAQDTMNIEVEGAKDNLGKNFNIANPVQQSSDKLY